MMHAVIDERKKGHGELAKKSKYRERLAIERVTGEPQGLFTSLPTNWGEHHEMEAVEGYELLYEKTEPADFVYYGEYAGCTPDRYVGEKGLLEVKCPYSEDVHRQTIDNGVPEKHKGQIQAQLLMTGREFCDFVSYDPRAPGIDKICVYRVEPDQEIMAEIEGKMADFNLTVEKMCEEIMPTYYTDIEGSRQLFEEKGFKITGGQALWRLSYRGLEIDYRPVSQYASIFGQNFKISAEKLAKAADEGRLRPKLTDKRYRKEQCKCGIEVIKKLDNKKVDFYYDSSGGVHDCFKDARETAAKFLSRRKRRNAR